MVSKKVRMFLIALAVMIFVAFVALVAYQAGTVNNAHKTFEGYCAWRGLEIVNKSSDFGYCINAETNQTFRIVLYKNAWYLDGDLPWR